MAEFKDACFVAFLAFPTSAAGTQELRVYAPEEVVFKPMYKIV